MAIGFHQIQLDASVSFTGFVTAEGHYEYLKMPYGLLGDGYTDESVLFFFFLHICMVVGKNF